MSMHDPNLAALIAKAAEMEDQSVEQESTYVQEIIPAGKTIGRFIEYVELGKHKQPDYQGKPKPDAEMIRVTFELLHPKKNIKEYEVDGQKVVSGQLISLMLAKKLSDKAKFKRLYNKMTYGRDSIKHMAQMLGEAFVIEIYHNVVKKDGKDVTYVNLDKDGDYGIGAPFIVDPIDETRTDVPVQEPTKPIRLFLWGNPTKETWDSLFIDGTREKKNADGSVEQVSKNWLQERILSATNFNGSALQQMLGGIDGLPVNEPVSEDGDEPPFDVGNETVTETTAEVEQKVREKQEAKPAGNAADDALAALGLT